MHDRLTGALPSPAITNVSDGRPILDVMEEMVSGNDPFGAAMAAIDDSSSSAFYNVTLKNFAAPWTNRDQSVFVPLNDYTATVIGMVRDEVDFRQLLYGDILYTVNGSPAGFSPVSNAHYEQAEQAGIDLRVALDGTQPQSTLLNIPSNATAGIMTSRAGAKAFFYLGTNRAMFRFTMLNHLCYDLEQVKDETRPADRIRQDVTRSPGGDSRVYLNNCVACHSGMDPLAQAYAYYEYSFDRDNDPNGDNGQLIYTAGAVQPKNLINPDNFRPGFVTPDDSWDNYWREGPNASAGFLDWDSSLPGSGAGAKSMGRELAHSGAFARCQVQKVFKAVCLRSPSATEQASVLGAFQGNGYSLKHAFAQSAVECRQ